MSMVQMRLTINLNWRLKPFLAGLANVTFVRVVLNMALCTANVGLGKLWLMAEAFEQRMVGKLAVYVLGLVRRFLLP